MYPFTHEDLLIKQTFIGSIVWPIKMGTTVQYVNDTKFYQHTKNRVIILLSFILSFYGICIFENIFKFLTIVFIWQYMQFQYCLLVGAVSVKMCLQFQNCTIIFIHVFFNLNHVLIVSNEKLIMVVTLWPKLFCYKHARYLAILIFGIFFCFNE